MKAKKTIRKLPPLSRRVAKLTRELNGIKRRLEHLTDDIASWERDARLFAKRAVELQGMLDTMTGEPPEELFPPEEVNEHTLDCG